MSIKHIDLSPNFTFSIDLWPGVLLHRLALTGTTAAGYGASHVLRNVVQRYVRQVRRMNYEQRANQELVWHPGETQADFGEADFIERGEKIRKKYLTLSFPQSNNSFTQVLGPP